MSGSGPPKCKTAGCGKAEWFHLCSGGPVMIAGVRLKRDGRDWVVEDSDMKALPAPKQKAVTAEAALVEPKKRGRPPAETDRKAYRAEKARQYRAKGKKPCPIPDKGGAS